MRARSLVIAVLVSLASTTALAQQSGTSWEAIAPAKGKSILVVRNDGKSHSGKLEQVSGDTLTVTNQQQSILIRRDDIRHVYSQTGRSRKRGALWGLAIGAGSGAVIGAASTHSCSNCIISISRGEGAAIGAAAGAAVGTLVGTLVGGKRKQVLLYDSSVSGAAP